MMCPTELEVGLEAVEPFDQVESPRQFDEGPELLWKDHAGGVALAVDVATAVLVSLELHVLEEGLRHRVKVLEGLEGRTHRRAPAPPRPGPAPRRVGPRGAHVAVEDVESALADSRGYEAKVGEDCLIREQVPLRVLHADGGVHGARQPEARHIRDVETYVEALVRRPLLEEGDVLRRQVEARHAVAAPAEPDQVRARAAGDVEHGPHGALRIAAA